MAKHKKVVRELEGNPEPIKDDVVMVLKVDNDDPFEPLEVPKTVLEKPVFTDIPNVYRELLLERPAVPTLTNMQEAIHFIEAYQRWNNKVQIAFK